MYAVAPIYIETRARFGTFDTAGPPPRVDYCGRRYYPSAQADTLAAVKTFLAENHQAGLTRIDSTPSGMPILANVLPPDVRAEYHTDVCAMGLWVQTGPDTYLAYGLSGGP